MRYLRKFRLFESSSLEDLVQDLQSEIEDEFKNVRVNSDLDFYWISVIKGGDVDHEYFHKFLISQIDQMIDQNVEIGKLKVYYDGNSGFTNTYKEFKSLPPPSLNYDECNIVFEI